MGVNITVDLHEVGGGGMDWTDLGQDTDRRQALVNAVMNLRVPLNAGNFLTSCKPISFSRQTLLQEVTSIFFLTAAVSLYSTTMMQ
jgi:hypothetical protein